MRSRIEHPMLDWDDLRSFLAIARHGNLSAAARALHVTQTTMGRRLDALHARAGARLLQKTPAGFVLTPAGARVLAAVECMEAEALAVERAIAGEDARVEGEVRITTVETFGARILVPLLQPLLTRHPALSIELITDTRALSLSRREADLAIRLAQFEQHETIVRRVGDMGFALYASEGYLAAHGEPDFAVGAPGHSWITLQADLALLPEAKYLARLAPNARVALRTNSRDAQLEAASTSLGIAMLPCYLADPRPGLVRLPAPGPTPVRGIWLGLHRDTRHVERLRLVVDSIADGLRRLAPVLNPAGVPVPRQAR